MQNEASKNKSTFGHDSTEYGEGCGERGGTKAKNLAWQDLEVRVVSLEIRDLHQSPFRTNVPPTRRSSIEIVIERFSHTLYLFRLCKVPSPMLGATGRKSCSTSSTNRRKPLHFGEGTGTQDGEWEHGSWPKASKRQFFAGWLAISKSYVGSNSTI